MSALLSHYPMTMSIWDQKLWINIQFYTQWRHTKNQNNINSMACEQQQKKENKTNFKYSLCVVVVSSWIGWDEQSSRIVSIFFPLIASHISDDQKIGNGWNENGMNGEMWNGWRTSFGFFVLLEIERKKFFVSVLSHKTYQILLQNETYTRPSWYGEVSSESYAICSVN